MVRAPLSRGTTSLMALLNHGDGGNTNGPGQAAPARPHQVHGGKQESLKPPTQLLPPSEKWQRRIQSGYRPWVAFMLTFIYTGVLTVFCHQWRWPSYIPCPPPPSPNWREMAGSEQTTVEITRWHAPHGHQAARISYGGKAGRTNHPRSLSSAWVARGWITDSVTLTLLLIWAMTLTRRFL